MWWLTLLGAALAGPWLQVEVRDAEGEVVPGTALRFADEGVDRHQVHGQTGRWAADALFTPTGRQLDLKRGMVVQVDVWAPGYGLERVELTVQREVSQVVITPLDLQSGDPRAQATLEAVAAWRDHEAAGPGEDAESWQRERWALERAVWVESSAWLLDDIRNPMPLQLCQQTATHPRQCGR